jgi:hypothetical protein
VPVPCSYRPTRKKYATTPIEDDKIHATTVPGGNRSKLLQLGPVISYDFFGLGRPWNITFKGLFAATGSHTAAPNLFVIRIGMKLF